MKSKLKIVLLSIVGLFIICLIAVVFYIQNWIKTNEALAFSDATQEDPALFNAYLADLKSSPTDKIFPHSLPASEQKFNAGVLLNSKFDWDSENSSLKESGPKIALSKETVTKLNQWKNDFPRHADEIKALRIDTSWMAELSKYDHWELEKDSPLEKLIATTPGWTGFMAPLPKLQAAHWAKIRLAAGLNEPSMKQAFQEVRQWAYLIASQESVVAIMLSISVLRQERIMLSYLNSQGKDFTDFFIPTNQEIDKLRAVWSASTVGFRFTSNQTIERFLLSSKGTIPLCAGLRDSGWNMLFDKSLLGKSDPQVFAPLATALKATLGKCRLGQLRDSYNDPNWFSAELRKTSPFALAVIGNSSGPTPDREMTDAHKDWNKLEQIPYIQKMIGLTLVNVSKPDVFRFYRNFKEKEVAGK